MIRSLAIAISTGVLCFFGYLFLRMFIEAVPSFAGVGLFKFGYWDYREGIFHAASMLYGTAVVSIIALLLAVPIGLGAAIFISEFISGKLRASAKFGIELLAGIPSVVYGLLGVTFLSRWLSEPLMALGGASGDSLLTAGILLGTMILPTMVAFSDDALRCVPRAMRESAWGLGMSKMQAILHVVLPQSRRGIVSAAMLAWGRAIGETVAIYLVVGRSDQSFSLSSLSWHSLANAGQTMTTKLGGAEIAMAYGDRSHWSALMALGIYLWLAVGIVSYLSESLIKGRKL